VRFAESGLRLAGRSCLKRQAVAEGLRPAQLDENHARPRNVLSTYGGFSTLCRQWCRRCRGSNFSHSYTGLTMPIGNPAVATRLWPFSHLPSTPPSHPNSHKRSTNRGPRFGYVLARLFRAFGAGFLAVCSTDAKKCQAARRPVRASQVVSRKRSVANERIRSGAGLRRSRSCSQLAD